MNPFIAKDDGKYVLFSITFAVVPYVGTWIEIFFGFLACLSIPDVVPYVGTWIEMRLMVINYYSKVVVPYVGTWIEICSQYLPSRVSCVVPYVGTWIEIVMKSGEMAIRRSRSLRGNVDRNLFRIDRKISC